MRNAPPRPLSNSLSLVVPGQGHGNVFRGCVPKLMARISWTQASVKEPGYSLRQAHQSVPVLHLLLTGPDAMIEVKDISKHFGTVQAVPAVSFTAPDGRITGLLGPNGAGKSTTLRIISTVLKPGHRQREGGRQWMCARTARLRASARCVCRIQSGLYPRLTARENIRYYGELNGLGGAALQQRIEELVELLEIGEFADRPAKGFSQGQTHQGGAGPCHGARPQEPGAGRAHQRPGRDGHPRPACV